MGSGKRKENIGRHIVIARNRHGRTLAKYSLLLAISLSRLANNAACSCACASTLSTSAFLNVTGGSKKETVPSADNCADISEDAIWCRIRLRVNTTGRAAATQYASLKMLTISRINSRTWSTFSIPTARAMSDKCSVRYVDVSFLIDHLGARSSA